MSGTVTALDNTSGGTGGLSGSSATFNSTNAFAYSFTPGDGDTWELGGLRVALRAASTAGTYTFNVALYLSSSSEPTGGVLASVSLSVSLTTTAGYQLFSEAQLGAVADYTLDKGTAYALVFTSVTGVRWSYHSVTDTQPDGDNGFNYEGYRSRANSGSAWSEPGDKVAIQVLAEATCFLRGTRILTDRGEVAVEALRAGDLVATRFGGLRPIRWIGLQCFEGRLAGPAHQPVRFRPGSLGELLPRDDLFVSPGHAILVGELLVHAGALVNGVNIVQERVRGVIEYFHLDLGPHDCVLANGTWAESYFEDHNRATFHNVGAFRAEFPDHVPQRQPTCLPIVTAACPQIAALRAGLTPSGPADVHLLADGRRLPLVPGPKGWEALVPAGVRSLRLRSRAARPCDLGESRDVRRLGVMVTTLMLDGERVDLAELAEGWFALEQADGRAWRWTDGDAALPSRPGRLLLRMWMQDEYEAALRAAA